jgi:hypothetical protein
MSSYSVGSSFADTIVEEDGRTYHVFKDGSEFLRYAKCNLLTSV